MQVIHFILRGSDLQGRTTLKIATNGHLGVHGVDEYPAVANSFTADRQILPVRGKLPLKGFLEFNAARFAVEFVECDGPAICFLIFLQRSIRPGSARRGLES